MKILITILITAIIVSVGAYVLCSLKMGIRHAVQVSEVEYPMDRVLDDIAATAEAGDCQLAKSKIASLRRYWANYYLDDGPAPDRFMHEIIHLSE